MRRGGRERVGDEERREIGRDEERREAGERREGGREE